MALTVCLSAFYVSLKHLWGRVGSTDVRRTADASRLSQGFRAKEPSVDPTRRVNMSVFSTEVFIVNWRADLRKYNKKLSYRRGTARCVVSVEILPIAKQQCRRLKQDLDNDF